MTIADATSSTVLTLWESDIKSFAFKIGQSYQLNRVQVRIFRGKHYLSFPPTVASIDAIEDIGEVIEDSLLEESPRNELLKGVSITGVNKLQNIYVCIFCKKGTIEDTGSNIGTCQNCKTTQLLKKKKFSAKLFLETPTETHISVRAYDEALKQITQDEEVTIINLLNAPSFDVEFNNYHVVTNVTMSTN